MKVSCDKFNLILFVFSCTFVSCRAPVNKLTDRTKNNVVSVQPVDTFNGETFLFKDHSFDSGNYKIIGLLNYLHPSDIQKKLDEFYIDDIKLLNEIKSSWAVTQPKTLPGHKGDHFYHYWIAIIKNGKVTDQISINFDSAVVLTKKGSYSFDINNLKLLIGKVKKLERKEYKFNSYDSAKAFVTGIHKDPNLVFAEEEWNWEDYEGSFNFFYNSQVRADTVMNRLKKNIAITYPNEPFKIEIFMISPDGELGFKLSCNKSLYDRFKLRKDGWEPLNFYLGTYWKQ